jgi:hypothetical protein
MNMKMQAIAQQKRDAFAPTDQLQEILKEPRLSLTLMSRGLGMPPGGNPNNNEHWLLLQTSPTSQSLI